MAEVAHHAPDGAVRSTPTDESQAGGLITPAGLKRATWRFVMHMHMTRGDHVYNYACVEFPGLSTSKATSRRQGTTTLTWFVAGNDREFDTREEAAKAWNERRRCARAGFHREETVSG